MDHYLALIDGDILKYELGFACQQVLNEERRLLADFSASDIRTDSGGVELLVMKPHIARHIFITSVNSIINNCPEYTDKHKFYVTSMDKSNFRFDIAVTKPYKGQRKTPKPIYYEMFHELLMEYYGAIEVSGQEADDALGIEMWTNWLEDPERAILFSRDKDLLMLPGKHYNWRYEGIFSSSLIGNIWLTPKDKVKGCGLKFFYLQLLMGDSVDNIQGVPKIGNKKAYKIITEDYTNIEDLQDKVLKVYQDYYGEEKGKEIMLEMGRLLWIRRKSDELWDFDTVKGYLYGQAIQPAP